MLSIHQAATEDIPAIKKLLYENWMAAYLGTYTQDQLDKIIYEWHSPELLAKQINDPSIHFFVAKESEELIGLCNGELIENGYTVTIERLHVSCLHQRKGIGTILLAKTIDSFPKTKKVVIDVEKHNYNAIRFYSKLGFVQIGETTITMQGETMYQVVMEKQV